MTKVTDNGDEEGYGMLLYPDGKVEIFVHNAEEIEHELFGQVIADLWEEAGKKKLKLIISNYNTLPK